jgi:hypothetical protein
MDSGNIEHREVKLQLGLPVHGGDFTVSAPKMALTLNLRIGFVCEDPGSCLRLAFRDALSLLLS